MSGPSMVQRTALQLYRDCLRLVKHVAPGHSGKATALRSMVRAQFDAHRHLTHPGDIEAKKADAVRALANYMVLQSASRDDKLSRAASRFHERSVEQAAELREARNEEGSAEEKTNNDNRLESENDKTTTTTTKDS